MWFITCTFRVCSLRNKKQNRGEGMKFPLPKKINKQTEKLLAIMRVKCKRNNFYFMAFISRSVISQYWVHNVPYERSLFL